MKLLNIFVALFILPSILIAETQEPVFTYTEITPVGPMIEFSGDFIPGLAKRFEGILKLHPNVKTISLSSNGGLLSEGYAVGELFSNKLINVWVPKDAACISACALAFLGGAKYKISGLLAFHAPWLPQYDGRIKLEDIYSTGQSTGADQSYWFAANGFRAQFYQMIAKFTNRETFVILTSTKDLELFLMIDGRTYSEYLTYKPVPDSVIQGGMEALANARSKKLKEIWNDRGIGDPSTSSDLPPPTAK